MGLKNRVTFVSLSLVAIASIIGIISIQYLFSTRVEAQSPQRFQVQYSQEINPENGWKSFNLVHVCDTATGDLYTVAQINLAGGVTVSPNRCQKNSSK